MKYAVSIQVLRVNGMILLTHIVFIKFSGSKLLLEIIRSSIRNVYRLANLQLNIPTCNWGEIIFAKINRSKSYKDMNNSTTQHNAWYGKSYM